MANKKRHVVNPKYIDTYGTLSSLISALEGVKENVPVDYWDSITYEMSAYDGDAEWDFYYESPETPEEESFREKQDELRKEATLKYKRLQLETLKKELGE